MCAVSERDAACEGLVSVVRPHFHWIVWTVLVRLFVSSSGYRAVAVFLTSSLSLCLLTSSSFVRYFFSSRQVWSKNPGWRPAYRFYHWSMSLLGAILCIAAMLIMEWISSIIALLLAAVIAVAIYASPQPDTVGNWGDAAEAAKHMAIRRNLLGLRTSKCVHCRGWLSWCVCVLSLIHI